MRALKAVTNTTKRVVNKNIQKMSDRSKSNILISEELVENLKMMADDNSGKGSPGLFTGKSAVSE